MAHMIENNMIAFVGETPWHGLGVKVDPTLTPIQWLIAAGMNWEVKRHHIAMRDTQGNLLTEPLKGYRSIVRSDNNTVFQVATERYQPIQNQQIVEFFQEYCNAGHATLETVGAIGNGKKVWALAKLNGGTSTVIGGSESTDAVTGYMLLATSHDGSLTTVGKATQVRVVCYNTLSAALGLTGKRLPKKEKAEFRLRHTTKWTEAIADRAKAQMGMAIERIQATNELSTQLSRVSIDADGRIEFVKRLLQGETVLDQIVADSSASSNLSDIIAQTDNQTKDDDLGRLGSALLDSIINSPGADLPSACNTLWGAVNGVTFHVDHVKGRSQDTRLDSAWFGPGEALKTKAVQVAVDMAGLTV